MGGGGSCYTLRMNKLKFIHRAHYPNNNGFTIIEVVLVLAIAGLIFLTVFLALPALQKSQRDNARRQDVGKVIAGLQQYRGDNGGWPSSQTYDATTGTGYFANLAQAVSVWVRPANATCGLANDSGALSIVTVAPGCKCDQNGTTDIGVRYGYVHIKLESGAQYCREM